METIRRTGNPGRQVPALPARLPQPRNRRRRRDLPEVRPGRHGGHRGRIRVRALHRLRPGREPDAHHQGRHGRHPGRLDAQSEFFSAPRVTGQVCSGRSRAAGDANGYQVFRAKAKASGDPQRRILDHADTRAIRPIFEPVPVCPTPSDTGHTGDLYGHTFG